MGGEKTIILGCYKGGDRGIYLYRVSDPRLDGVVEVTAAHEMLHAAYERLSSDERRSLDRQLEAFYRQSLRDERVKTTVDSYKTLEPSELPNEMHSIFATEVAVLPTELEQYYTRYFRDRQRVVALATAYQSEFTLRREQVALYDAELAAVKTTIDSNQAGLTTQRRTLETRQAELTRLRASGDIAGYNARVAGYNQLVDTYNETIQSTRGLITHYTDTVEKRNAIALEERQLTQALSADSLPTQQ
jgi:flagellar biosynthesis chaperone FliJ